MSHMRDIGIGIYWNICEHETAFFMGIFANFFIPSSAINSSTILGHKGLRKSSIGIPLGSIPKKVGQGPTKNLLCDQVFSEEGIPALYRGISMERVLGLGMGGSMLSHQSFLTVSVDVVKPMQPIPISSPEC